ncbi:hypothetical protein GC175_04110 [bacterium]|nr:hypothetical protein [bacterium]
MNTTSYIDGFFCNLSPTLIVEFIEKANGPICYAAPGVQLAPAQALVKAADRLGPEMLTVWIDFDERVMRMGYGDIEAVTKLRDAGITVHHAPGLRSALIIADGEGYTYTPTPLYLEAEPNSTVRNALRLSTEQVSDALARLSPNANTAPKLLPEAQQTRMFQPPFEQNPAPVTDTQFAEVNKNLQDAPPIKFDLTRQVRVFEPYLQYVELKLTGAAIHRHRLAIPPSIQKLGGNEALEGRLRTTFDLIEKDGNLSPKALEDMVGEIRTSAVVKNYRL